MIIVNNKKKKSKLVNKRKVPYNYHSRKNTKEETTKLSPEERPNILYDNYYLRNESIFSTEQMILASSKKDMMTLEPSNYDISAIDTNRIKTTFVKGDTLLRSAASIVETGNNLNPQK